MLACYVVGVECLRAAWWLGLNAPDVLSGPAGACLRQHTASAHKMRQARGVCGYPQNIPD
eukprot:357423-Chlamydomonas_euryale.AAC.4